MTLAEQLRAGLPRYEDTISGRHGMPQIRESIGEQIARQDGRNAWDGPDSVRGGYDASGDNST